MDFVRIFGITIDGNKETIKFRDAPNREFTFKDLEFESENYVECNGIVEISDLEKSKLKEFLEVRLPSVSSGYGKTSLVEHKIDVQGHSPIKQRYSLVSPKVKEAMYEEVDRMVKDGVIQPSSSAWSTPIVMIKKSNGKYRFCLDFRKVNSVAKGDAYPFPYMNDILEKLRSAEYLSIIDLSQAYHQIPLEEKSKEVTAFTVSGKGLFQFTRMPYGLSGVPATFQRLLDEIIGTNLEEEVFAYLDDIIIATQTFEKHLEIDRYVSEGCQSTD